MSRALGVVVIGTGFGCFTPLRALRNAGFEVRALVGRDAAKTERRARACGVERALTSVDAALALPGVDAVMIATPPHTHAPLALAAIGAGRHVLCEKPFARDAAEGRAVLAAAESAGVVHVLGTEYRFDAGQALLARIVRSGAIGAPRLVAILMQVPMLADAGAAVPEWWADAAQGGGWLGAHGSQVIDQVRVALGELESVCATLVRVAERDMSAEDGFVIQLRMRCGATGVLQSTSGDWGAPLVATRITGTRGSAWIDGVGSRVWLADRDGTRRVPAPDELRGGAPDPPPPALLETAYERMIAHGLDVAPYTRLAGAFRDAILGRVHDGPERPATFRDGVAMMEVLDAVRRSAAEKRWVDMTPDRAG
jgi:predicted dehydrogenase